MKLGYIDYLNCYPFYYHMLMKQPVEQVEIIPGYPSTLNRMMRRGSLDMSPVSSATCADIAEDVLVETERRAASENETRNLLKQGVPADEAARCTGRKDL